MSDTASIETRDSDLIEHILAALRTDAGLQELLGTPARIFDDETRAGIFPYVVLERCERSDTSVTGVPSAEHRLQFATQSRDGGQSSARMILATLRTALLRMDLNLDGQRITFVHPTYSDVMRAPNRQFLRGVLRVRILTEEI